MPLPVILDATPLAGGHGARGIGTAVRGLVEAFAERPEGERPQLLVSDDVPPAPAFTTVPLSLPGWPLWRLGVPDPWPALVAGRVLRRVRAAVFHATRPELVPSGLATVVSCYDLIPLRMPSLYLDGTRRAAQKAAYAHYLSRLRSARLVLAPTRATADDLILLAGVDADRVRIVPLGVATSAEGGRLGAPPIGSRKPYLLYSGSLEPHKNVPLLVDALAQTRHAEVRLVMTGPWSRRRRERLERRIASRGLSERVSLRGHVDSDELARLRRGALAVAVPSRIEGFGLPALEAMAAGVPVLASDIPALAEVTGGVCPLISPDDPAGWATQIDRMLEDPAARADAARRGPGRAAAFPWSATAAATLEVYREALDA